VIDASFKEIVSMN